MSRKLLFVGVLLSLFVGPMVLSLQAATPQEIEESVQDGISWLVTQQQANGSWTANGFPVGETGLVLSKLVERAHELGQDPFDTSSYAYAQNVIDGYNYLFSQAGRYTGRGYRWYGYWKYEYGAPAGTLRIGNHVGYENGISMMAIAATKEPDKVVSSSNAQVNGLTYKQVLQEMVDHTVWAQMWNGGWHYTPFNNYGRSSDNSPSGYTVLGLRYAEAAVFGFECVIPDSTKTRLKAWVDYIQDDANGASGYNNPWEHQNVLKTGNLLFQAEFADPNSAWSNGVRDAGVGYIQNTWNTTVSSWSHGWKRADEKPWYQATYNLMKGFQSRDIDDIVVGVNTVDWFNGPGQIADAILAAQEANGSWASDVWGGNILSTAWALLTLEKIAPPPPINVAVVLDEEICDNDGAGYTVIVEYTSESANVDGSVVIKKDGALVDTVILVDFNGSAIWISDVNLDAAGTYTWSADLDVAPTGGGGTPAEADDEGSIVVIESPVVGDIPDQTTPFTPFDLDIYLSGGAPATWSSAGDSCLSVAMDGGNVVTVTNPGDVCEDAETVTFTAEVSGFVVTCSDSNDATFTPNQPPVAVCTDVTVAAGGQCNAPASIDDGSYDPDGPGDIAAITEVPGGLYPLGDTPATLTIVDQAGETGICTATVSVTDTTAPEITCPADVILECVADTDTSVAANGSAMATDNCSVNGVEHVDSSVPGCGNTEVITRTWTATDGSGNTATCVQTISVVDTTSPSLSSNVHDIYPSDAPITFDVTPTDACGSVDLDLTYNCEKTNKNGKIVSKLDSCVVDIRDNPVTIADSGGVDDVITISATATDECGNATAKVFTVNVLRPPNQGVGNGPEGGDPGNSNQGDPANSNDENGGSPGNPGKKGGKK